MFYELLEVNPETFSLFNLKPSDIYDYLKQLNFETFLILGNARPEHLNHIEISQTTNVLFIHKEKVNAYPELFNT